MFRIGRIVGTVFFLQWVLCAPSIAQEKAAGGMSFKPYLADGAPIQTEEYCGYRNANQDWLGRDLGEGVHVEVGLKYEKGMPISATLLFRYYDGKLELSPNEFELRAFPGEKIFKPSEIRRDLYKPNNGHCAQYGEWVYLKFPVQPEMVEQVALVFPSDTVKKKETIKVRPFRFEKTDGAAGSNSLSRVKPINVTPPLSAEDMQSCDPGIAIAAAEEVVNKPSTLKEPLQLFMAAAVFFQHGAKDKAVFWFYAAQLRVRYQLVFEQGDLGQILSIMLMTVGPPINNYAFQDVEKLNRILDTVLAWDKTAPNPFRNKNQPKDIEAKLEKVYSGFYDLKVKLSTEREALEQAAKLAAPQMELMSEQLRNRPCPN
ncbi:MAG: hypothetical protein EPO06_10830 [Burkholderiaceae bacterium]|nr:MAG: hypothetical protein EPO06_10830 [Burkholderiaceae bacterium]